MKAQILKFSFAHVARRLARYLRADRRTRVIAQTRRQPRTYWSFQP